jgi:AraC-like DNA-binding protein
MIRFNYKLTSYSAFLEQLSELLKARLDNGYMPLPEDVGTGYFQAIDVDGVDALLYDFKLNDDILFERKKDGEEYYTLIFDEVDQIDGFDLAIENQLMFEPNTRTSAIYLTSFLYDVSVTIHKNISLKGLRVCINREWMHKYLHLPAIEDVLEKYIELKTENVWYKPVDAESRELLQALLNTKGNNLLYYHTKILRIVEIFFEWLREESKQVHARSGISRVDIKCAQTIESILTSETTVLPPTIKELSRKAAMSESKLKKVFKSVYGLPIYEYFQKHRMQKARMMLLTGNYSIKDIGYSLGYSNLSNFTLAFKKEYGRLPSEVVKEVR